LNSKGSTYSIVKSIAETALNNQVVNPEDYTDENGILICGKCKEPKRKYIDVPNPTDENPSNKTPVMVTADCKCVKDIQAKEKAKQLAERAETFRAASLMDKKYKDAKFEKYSKTPYNEKNLSLASKYARSFERMLENNQGLILWGGVGTGKSFTAACIANYLIDHETSVLMTSFVKLLELIDSRADNVTNIIYKLNNAPLVIFDDLGAERATDYALEKVYSIIDSRYRARLPMILTTNLSIEEMKQETDIRYSRIYDRIFETCYPMQFTGPSWRKKEAFERFNKMEDFLNNA